MNRSLGEKMRMLLMQRKLPRSFWLYAIQAAAFKINLTPNVDVKRDSKRLDQQAIHGTLKEAPKLTTRNWYAWNPHFQGILSNWPTAVKHLNGTIAPEDKKYNCALNGELCTILQSSALLTGTNNVNYLFVCPANLEPWKLHNLYCRLKKDLMKMEKIAESTLLNEVGKICMFQVNICKLMADINEHWAKAKSMGHVLPEILKVKMLIDQAQYVTSYHHCIVTLEDTGMASNYEILCAALSRCQDSMTAQMDHRAGDLKTAQANLANGQDDWCNITSAYHASLDWQPMNWIVDSGATNHVINKKSNLISSTPCTGFVKTASGMKIRIMAISQAMLNVNGHEVLLDNILYVPDLDTNLILVKALANNGACVTFDSKHVILELQDGMTITSDLNSHTRHYEISQPQQEAMLTYPDNGLSGLPKTFDDETKAERHKFTPGFMHERCSHLGRNKLKLIEKLYKIKLPSCKCQDCIIGKSTKAQMGRGSGAHAKEPLDLVHVDLAMHWSTKTEVTCLLVAIDDASSFMYMKPLWAKLDALQVLKEWIHYAEVQTGHKLKTLHSDNGGKWILVAAISWQNEAGFCWQKTSAYTNFWLPCMGQCSQSEMQEA
ncbi:hypothetical protein NDA11_000432 [Ustilago hordei]|nr:hypothetical protein NDA11_000432 [Ustilago hordei]